MGVHGVAYMAVPWSVWVLSFDHKLFGPLLLALVDVGVLPVSYPIPYDPIWTILI